LQGEIVRKQEIQHSGTVGTTRGDVNGFISQILAEAKAIGPTPKTPPTQIPAITDAVDAEYEVK